VTEFRRVLFRSDFVQAGSGNIFEAGCEPTASAIADFVISKRAALDKAMARRRLANAVLPSLAVFEVTVDLRIRFEEGKVQEFVPVALAHIDTDADNTELWLQLSRADIMVIIDKLNKCMNEMALAEDILNTAMSRRQ